MTSILIAILMALVGYITFTLREYVNKYSVILLIFLMFVLDGIIVQSYYMLGFGKYELITGVLFGTIFKIIVFIVLQKNSS